MTLKTFSAALLSFALVIVGAIVTIPTGHFDWKAGIQLAILGITTAATLLLPLVPSAKWQGILKTGVPILLAILNGLTPLIVGGVYNHATVGLIALNALQAVASEVGVSIRTTSEATPAVR